MLNWMKLTATGRAKGQGQPWSPEENEALTTIAEATGLPLAEVAPYLREHGVLTVDQFRELTGREASGEKPDKHKTRKELEAKAKKLKVDFDPALPDAELKKLIAAAEEAANAPKGDDTTNTGSDANTGGDSTGDDANAGGGDTGGDSTGDQGGDAAPLSRAELEAKATALNIRFTANMKDETIAAKIAEAEAADNKN